MSDQIKYVAKALVGAAVAALTALSAGIVDGGVDLQTWILAATAFLVAFSAVYFTPNGEKPL